MISTHKVEVVPVILEPHPHADALSIVRVHSAYTVVVRTVDWTGIDRGAYIIPDSVVPDTEGFSFLNGKRRIKVKRLRGIISQGLLVPAPEGSKIGDDVAELIGVTHYEPPEPASTGGEAERPPELYSPTYDIDTIRKYAHVFQEGEHVIVTCKIHGTSARYAFSNGRMYAGSKREWKRESDSSVYWRIIKQQPSLTEFCKLHPELIVYGEVFGCVQDLKYGMTNGKIDFRVFDLFDHRIGLWLDYDECINIIKECSLSGQLNWVPLIAREAFQLDKILEYAEGNSLIDGANHIREGIVVKPIKERIHPEIGRVCLKVVSNGYYER